MSERGGCRTNDDNVVELRMVVRHADASHEKCPLPSRSTSVRRSCEPAPINSSYGACVDALGVNTWEDADEVALTPFHFRDDVLGGWRDGTRAADP